jgi:DNA repair protein RecO (recombination protein O)
VAIQKTQGFILNREDIRETSLVVTIFTRDFGKLKFISKGVRTAEQRFISAYELFALDDIVFYERRKKGLFLLSQCELVDYFPVIRNSLERMSYAAYFAQFTDAVTPAGEKNEKIYWLLEKSLRLLSGEASPKRVARIFEIKLLSLLGLMPKLRSCAGCDTKVTRIDRFSVSMGGVLCDACRLKDKGAKSVLPGTANFISHIEQSPFEKIGQVKVAKAVGSEVEGLLRTFIDYHLDVKLKSLEFIWKIGV